MALFAVGVFADGFKNVRNFDGRDRWFDFWWYALPTFLFGLFVVPVVTSALYAPGKPIDTTEVVVVRTVAGAVVISLLAAAVSRRLRDVGFSARWGLLPVVPYVVGTLAAHPLRAFETGRLVLFNVVTIFLWLVLMGLLLLPSRRPASSP